MRTLRRVAVGDPITEKVVEVHREALSLKHKNHATTELALDDMAILMPSGLNWEMEWLAATYPEEYQLA